MQVPQHGQNLQNLIIGSSFVVCLLVFFWFSVANCLSNRITLNENRFPAPFPKLDYSWNSLTSFSHGFEAYFNDRFVFRNLLVSSRAQLFLKLFHMSGNQEVLLGKNGFFFYADKPHLAKYTGKNPFSQEDLIRWKKYLEHYNQWCADRGIDYQFVIAPSKSTIYPEFLPNEYSKVKETRADQLVNYLKASKCPVRVLDLRTTLRAVKGDLPLYFKTDTHWNQLGAYYGYEILIESLRAQHPEIHAPLKLTDFNVLPITFTDGDLARIQGLFGILSETSVGLERKRPSTANLRLNTNFSENKLGFGNTRAHSFSQNKPDLPSVVMFRDSFATNMIELPLPEHFSRIVFFWQIDFSESLVEREKPDIVVQELVESKLY